MSEQIVNISTMRTSATMSSLMGKLSRNNFVLTPEERLMFEQIKKDSEENPEVHGDLRVNILMLHSGGGYCYFKLVSVLESFKDCKPPILEFALIKAKETLEPNLPFEDVIMFLMLMDDVMKTDDPTMLLKVVPSAMEEIAKGDEKPGDSIDIDESMPFMQNLIKTPVKFGYCEISGVIHLTRVNYPPCACETGTQLVCEHGWSMRFLMCIMNGRQIGASIDLNALFTSIEDAEEDGNADDEISDDGSICQTPRIGFNRSDSVIEMNAIIDDKNNEIERLTQRLSQRKQSGKAAPNSGLSRSNANKGVHTELTIEPSDSSSTFERYTDGRRFMNQGTVLTVLREGANELSPIIEHHPLDVGYRQVRGYQMTNDLMRKKKDSDNKLTPINGLANPFKNDRLNLLIHIHTSIDDIMGKSNITIYDALRMISKKAMPTPTDELVKQIVTRTFDLRDNFVVSNPFKLPFIEIGMVLSDSCLLKCFTLLKSEYQIEWFKEMKCLKVPGFHSDFSSQSDRTLTLKYGRESKPSSSSSASRGEKSHRRRTSIIGF